MLDVYQRRACNIKDFYKKLKFYYNLLGDGSLIEFEKLTIDRVRELVRLSDLIQKRPKIGVEEYQKITSNSLKREGWSFGEHLNLEKRKHPLAGEFSELSSLDKIKQSVLLTIAKHHFLPSNKINVKWDKKDQCFIATTENSDLIGCGDSAIEAVQNLQNHLKDEDETPHKKAVRQDIELHEENIKVSTGGNLTETDEPTNTEDSI
jgi:hypothetical protein